VVHVQIPASAIPTVVDQDASGRTYYEVYLATPNGISNRVLVPCQPANPAPQSAYDLTPDSHDLAIFYQRTPLTIKLVPYVTGKNALPGVSCPEPPAPPEPATKTSAPRSSPAALDNSVRPVVWNQADPSFVDAAGTQLPSLPHFPGVPPISPPGASLLSPSLSSESTAAARMLGGLPPLPSPLATAVSTISPSGAVSALQNAASAALPNPMPSIVVTPSPVVVVNSAAATQARSKPRSRLSRLFHHGPGQGQAAPAQPPR